MSAAAAASPQPIPGASATTQKSKTRSRSQTYAYNRLDADGNVHHLPPDAAVYARSPPSAISSGSNLSNNSQGGILGLLGLSPKSSTSNSTIIPFSVPSSSPAAGAPVLESPSSSSYSSSATGEEAPEAVTPPLLHKINSRDSGSVATLPAIEQLDEDVFDDDFPLTGRGNDSYRKGSLHTRSASVGRYPSTHKSRRSSWSPVAASNPDDKSTGDERPALSASPNTVTNWLQTQEKAASTAISPTWAWYSQQQSRDSGFRDSSTASSANPIGLFRRLSISSASRRPTPAAPASVTSEASEMSDRPGRPAEKSQGPAPRKLSPMGKRMLMGHFHQFS